MAEGRSTTRRGGASGSGSSRAKPASSRAASSGGAGGSKAAAKRSSAAKKGGQARGRQQKARKGASTAARGATKPAAAAGVEAKTVGELRKALREALSRPAEQALVTRDRIEEALSKSGKLSPKEISGIASDVLKRGQKQTNDVLTSLEKLLDEGRSEVGGRAAGARKAAVRAASTPLAQADRVRRSAGVGSNFPISLYESLNVPQIKSRLGDLTPAELRKVRDYERRNAKRKGILGAIESKLR